MKPEVNIPEPVTANVTLWCTRIREAKARWRDDFERMRANMRFAAGYQWAGQEKVDDDRYVSNMTLRAVNQKVASLYARNPKAVVKLRDRMDYRLWDERIETLNLAVLNEGVESMALIEDYQSGRAIREMLARVARTLEIVYQYQIDRHEPEFKCQMKQLVRRAVTTGVGFVRIRFEREYESGVSPNMDSNAVTLARESVAILEKIQEGEISSSDAEIERLRMAVAAMQEAPEQRILSERLVFDFPPSTSVIVDPKCRALRGFIGADWVAQEYVLPLSQVEAHFECDLQLGTDISRKEEATVDAPAQISATDRSTEDPEVVFWQVFDKRTKSSFYVCDGYKDYLAPPVPVEPRLHRFWPLFTLTFNDTEMEDAAESSTIYPPSDVQLMKHAQKEWNRTREELRTHRQANTPKYVTTGNWMTQKDRDGLENVPPHGIIDLQGLPPGVRPAEALAALQHAPLDPLLYDVAPLKEDILFTTGQQEANLGPAPSNVTATVGTIAEQSRLSVTASNVDDQDGLLTDMARAAGETLLLNMSLETVRQIAGPGAAWSEANRELFANELLLEVEAASSGRPNKAIEIANWERVAPILLQVGANPHYLIRRTLKILEDDTDPTEAFPVLGPPPQPGQEEQASPAKKPQASPAQPLQSLPSESPVPLAGA